MANGRYSTNPAQVDPNIWTALRNGVGSCSWNADIDNSNDPYQLLTHQVLRDAHFETLLRYYSWEGNASLYERVDGDYDADGNVDMADFQWWRELFGTQSAPLAADGNGDGIIDAADYIVWRKNLGQSVFATPATAEQLHPVPEPTTLTGILAALGFFLLIYRHVCLNKPVVSP
jgi:hypothetical protein